ncbi:MAG: hypothetical protein IKB98_10410 [Clostridia bacterium]|nr:hypothetical protein [Clostridia bacterium]
MTATTKTSLTKHVYKIDFENLMDKSNNLICDHNSLTLCKAFAKTGNFTADFADMVMNVYKVEGRTFFYMSSNSVCEFKNKQTYNISKAAFNPAPELIGVPYKGERQVLAVSNKTVEILGIEKKTLTESYGKYLTICNNVLFCAKDNCLYFTAPMKDDGGIENVELKNFITLPPQSGNIKGLYTFGKKLYVVCQRHIYHLTVTGKPLEYELKQESLLELNVLENTVLGNGDTFYFVSDKNLCEFNGKTLKKYDFLEEEINSFEFCGIADGCYLIQYYNQEQYLLRGFDFSKSLPFYTYTMHCFSKYGGLGIDDTYSLALFQKQINAGHFVNYYSKKFNMESGKRKRIIEIEGFSAGSIKLYIKGDFGLESVFIEGATTQKLNVISKDFLVYFSCVTGMLPLTDLKVKYQVLGE